MFKAPDVMKNLTKLNNGYNISSVVLSPAAKHQTLPRRYVSAETHMDGAAHYNYMLLVFSPAILKSRMNAATVRFK